MNDPDGAGAAILGPDFGQDHAGALQDGHGPLGDRHRQGEALPPLPLVPRPSFGRVQFLDSKV